MRIIHIVGARPNFMKVAPVYRALALYPNVIQQIVHTGQHYDFNMSEVFFQQLGIPTPDINLEAGSGTHARQTAEIMIRLEPVLLNQRPDWLLVYGDVNSTVAAALVCSKLGIRVGHVEAGLRSGDRSMPEEINRLITDQLSDVLFTPSQDGNSNLEKEGIAREKAYLVGNVMIDTLLHMLPAARASVDPALEPGYVLVTLHRPANVDDVGWLSRMLSMLESFAERVPILFPVHPRTRQRIADAGIRITHPALKLVEPQPYVQFLGLESRAGVVLTDSGGIQEETTFLGVPCLTVRENTERPVTISHGTNELVGCDPPGIGAALERALSGQWKKSSIPPLWDGHAGERIAALLAGVQQSVSYPQSSAARTSLAATS